VTVTARASSIHVAIALAAITTVAAACGAPREAAPSRPAAPAPFAPPRAPGAAECRRALPAACGAAAPSYARDVAPILSRRCFACHAGDGVAADEHDFSAWPTLYAQRAQVAAQVGACAMPPRRAPALPEDEAETLLLWIACGAPKE